MITIGSWFQLAILVLSGSTHQFMIGTFDDDPKTILENSLQARVQLINFEGSIFVEQTKGQLWDMPQKMQFDIRIDEVNKRSWYHRIPLVPVEIPENDPKLSSKLSRWLESYAMYRDERWSYGIDGKLLLSSKKQFPTRRGFNIHTLGIAVSPTDDWTSKDIEWHRGMFGLTIPENEFLLRSDSRLVNGVQLQGIDCVEKSGKIRTFWIERETLRIHRIEIPYPFSPEGLNEGDVGKVVSESTFLDENDTVVPNRVVITEDINGIPTQIISIDLIKFDQEKLFKEEDFSYSNMGVKINRFVEDLDTGRVLGYWNGRDWSSRAPITGGDVVQTAIQSSEQSPSGTPLLKTVAVVSTIFAGVVLSLWLWRKYVNSNST